MSARRAASRLEETEKLVAAGRGAASARSSRPKELRTINETIGVPFSFNLAFVPSDNVSGMDAELLISLKPGHRPSVDYQRLIRDKLTAEFPGTLFYFQTADIVSQVLNFGLSAPIDIQIQDSNFARAYATAQRILKAIQKIPGVVDPRIVQVLDFPALQIDVDRLRAARLGIAQRDVANNMLTSLAGSALVGADLLPQSAERRELHRRGADAGGQDQHGLRRAEPAGQSGGAQHQSEHSADDAAHDADSPVTRIADIAIDAAQRP